MATKTSKSDNVLRYAGAGAPRVTPISHSPQEAERIERYALPPTSGHAQEVAALALAALCELPAWRFLESLMASASATGEPTAIAADQKNRATPMPAVMKPKRESKIEAGEPVKKYSAAKPPSENLWRGQASLPPASAPQAPKSLTKAEKVMLYKKLVGESQNRRLDYSRRCQSLDQAKSLHCEHVDSEERAGVCRRAAQRAQRERIDFGAALEIEERLSNSFSLPLPPAPAHVA